MEEGLVVKGRVEIDTQQPFKSVKEAVQLFGEKVLVREVYAQKLKEMGSERENNQHAKTIIDEEKKQTLESSNDKAKLMAYYLMSLKQQLQETKSELNQLRSTREPYPSNHTPPVPEIEEIKFMENSKPTQAKQDKHQQDDDNLFKLKRDDSDKFQTPPTKVIAEVPYEVPKIQERSNPSFKIKKTKKKTLIPLLSGIFSKTKG